MPLRGLDAFPDGLEGGKPVATFSPDSIRVPLHTLDNGILDMADGLFGKEDSMVQVTNQTVCGEGNEKSNYGEI